MGLGFGEKLRMRKVKLYIATSLDGYIARKDGALDWLDNIPHPENEDYGYQEFYDSIDTVIMGRGTYEVVLGFDVDWPYSTCTTLVMSSTYDAPITTPNTKVVNQDLGFFM